MIRHIAFKSADSHRLALFAENAGTFALFFLRADAAAYGGQAVGTAQNAVGFPDVSFRNFGNEFRDAHFHGATRAAQGLFALKAARGFGRSHFRSIAQRDFLEIFNSFGRSLTGHVRTGNPGAESFLFVHR